MSKNDGGPAFPRQTWDYYPSQKKTHADENYPGMSLRAWLAGQAMSGQIAATAGDTEWPSPKCVAERACSYADALLAELAKAGA